jgi:hypothetical protein
MNIGLIDNELCTRRNHSFPNLAIMKLSSYYKSKGDIVKLISFEDINPFSFTFNIFDVVFISKVFTDTLTPAFIDSLSFVKKGGSGFFYDKAEPLPYEIEHSMPDYHIYDNIPSCTHDYYKKYSIGFLTRGCIRRCSFCINQNSKKVEYNADIKEFYDSQRPYIMLLDDNITAYKNFYNVFENLNKNGTPFVFKQGMDFRLLNLNKMNILWNSNYLMSDKKQKHKFTRTFHFAFDNIDDYDIIEKKAKLYYENKPYRHNVWFYVLVGFDREGIYDENFYLKDIFDLLKRIELLFRYNFYPYIMIHKNLKYNPLNQIVKDLRTVCQHPPRITSKTMLESLSQSKCFNTIKWLENNKRDFLDIQMNTKMYIKIN